MPLTKLHKQRISFARQAQRKPIEYFIDKGTGCWLWTGAINAATGYGVYRNSTAHRAVYKHYKGNIPEGYQIDHLCSKRSCVNPKHLEAVTPKENTARASNAPATINRLKVKCNSGHPFTAENTYIKPDGYRNCRECRKLAKKRVKNANN